MASENTVVQTEWKPKFNPWIVSIPIIGAAFMFVLDETIANVALMHMAGSYSASREEALWILTSYLIASGIVIPAVDWFCKLMGRKAFFTFSVLLFVCSSFLCGISNTLTMMIFSRILQGLGGGALLPLAQAILLENFSIKDRGKAMALFGMVIVIAPIIGPVIGGWITDNFHWSWIFFINIPIGVATILLIKYLLEDPPYVRKQKNVKIDSLGFFLLTIWLVTLQVILDKGNNADWFNAVWVRRTALVSVLSAVLFFVSQLKRKDSLVDLSVFKDKNFTIGTLIQVIVNLVLLASMAILPQFLQTLMGYNAYLSGLTMMPRGAGSLTSVILSGLLSNKVDNRILLCMGLIFIGIAGFQLSVLNLEISMSSIAVPNFILGLGMGFSLVPSIALSAVTLSNKQMTNAAGLQNLLKNIGGAIGTSLSGTMIARCAQMHQYDMVKNLNELNPVFQERLSSMSAALSQYTHPVVAKQMAESVLYKQLVQQATLLGFTDTFRMFSVAAMLIIPTVFMLKNIDYNKAESAN